MKKVTLLIILTVLFLNQMHSQALSDFSFYLEPQIGLTFGKIGEYLHTGTSETSRVISYLEWKEMPVVYGKLKGGTAFSNFDIDGFISYALPLKCGQMTDSDWYVAGIKNKYGIFNNTIDANIDLGLTADYAFILPAGFTLKPIAGIEYRYISFKGTDGKGFYSSDQNKSWDSEAQVQYNLSGIDYYQHSFMLLAGLGTSYTYKDFTLGLDLLISPYAYFFFVDYHEDANNLGRDYSTISLEHSFFNLLAFEAAGQYKLTEKITLTMNISGKWMPEVKGQSANCSGNYITKQNTDGLVFELPQSTGVSLQEINISAGCKYNF